MRLRAPVPDDARAVLAVLLAREVADLGMPDDTLEEDHEGQGAPMSPVNQPKFSPKKPVMNDSSRKIVATSVSCFMVWF